MPVDDTGVRALLSATLDDLDQNSKFVGYMRRLTTATIDIDVKVDGLTDRVDRLTDKVDGLTDKVDGLTDRVDGLTDKVDGLDKKIDAVEGRLDKKIDAVEERLDKKIDAVEERLDKKMGLMHDDIRQTKAHVETIVGYIRRDELGKSTSVR